MNLTIRLTGTSASILTKVKIFLQLSFYTWTFSYRPPEFLIYFPIFKIYFMIDRLQEKKPQYLLVQLQLLLP